jgi:hypothetical protein
MKSKSLVLLVSNSTAYRPSNNVIHVWDLPCTLISSFSNLINLPCRLIQSKLSSRLVLGQAWAPKADELTARDHLLVLPDYMFGEIRNIQCYCITKVCLPNWTGARLLKKPRVNTVLVINVPAWEYPDFLTINKIIRTNRVAENFRACPML